MYNFAKKEVFNAQALGPTVHLYKILMETNIKHNMNKQITLEAGFNSNYIENITHRMKTFKNIFLNITHIDFTIFCPQMSI